MNGHGQSNQVAIPIFQVLSEQQRKTVLGAALEVMEITGIRIQHEVILSLIQKAGGIVQGDVAHIPTKIVEHCLKAVPKSFQLYTREGEVAIRLDNDLSYFGAGVGAPFILDSFNGTRRPFTTEDAEQAVLLQDALPNIDFVMAMGEISDIPDPEVADLYRSMIMLLNTSKPINFMATSLRNTSDLIEMASVLAGDETHIRQKPFIFLFGAGATPPLTYVRDKLDRLLLCVDKGIPFVSLSAAGSGGTAPVTLAGHVVTSLAEILTAVVMSQLRVEGAPILIGAIPFVMDMKTLIYAYGAPEFHLVNAAVTEVIRSLGIPSYGTAGVSDSKLFDEQAAIEGTLSAYFQALSRTNLIHDVGFVDSALVASFEMLVMCDEVIGMVKRVCRGMEIDEEHLALDTIHQVGPGGNYVSEMHTVRHFRKEQWRPNLIDRENFQTWLKKGSTSLKDRARERVTSILSSHRPKPIVGKQRKQILEIMNRRGCSLGASTQKNSLFS